MDRPMLSIGDAARALGLSVPQLRRLANAGRIPFVTSEGGHRRFDVAAVRSTLAGPHMARCQVVPFPNAIAPVWNEGLALPGLDESDVWQRASQALGLSPQSESYRVFHYTFSEMLNNAIDHSGGNRVQCSAWRAEGSIAFTVSDDGVGAFARLRDRGSPTWRPRPFSSARARARATQHGIPDKASSSPRRSRMRSYSRPTDVPGWWRTYWPTRRMERPDGSRNLGVRQLRRSAATDDQ